MRKTRFLFVALFVGLILFSNISFARFVSVDPLANKYPSISPYVYCKNNPMSNVDLNGDSVTVVQDVEIGPLAPEVQEYEKARAELMSTQEGATLVQEVESNEHANTIDLEGKALDPNSKNPVDPNRVTVASNSEGRKAMNGQGTKAHMQFIPNPSPPVKVGGKVQGTTIRLGHELSHMNHINKGIAAPDKTVEQRNAVKQENIIRKQLGLPTRKQ